MRYLFCDNVRMKLTACSVFVGKLKGRKVAISEFRGHLSESTSSFHSPASH